MRHSTPLGNHLFRIIITTVAHVFINRISQGIHVEAVKHYTRRQWVAPPSFFPIPKQSSFKELYAWLEPIATNTRTETAFINSELFTEIERERWERLLLLITMDLRYTLSMVRWRARRLVLFWGKKLRIINRFSIALFVPKYEIAVYDGGPKVVFAEKPYIIFLLS